MKFFVSPEKSPNSSKNLAILAHKTNENSSFFAHFQKLKCQRKDPCKLFTVRKRQEQVDEVNTNALCQCASGYRCPKLHTDIGVILGRNYVEDNIRTYSGYCMKEN